EQFLESEGISKTTAWRYMEMAAGRPVSFQSTDEVKRPVDNHPGEIIGDAPSGPRLVPDAPDFDPVPQPPAPLPRPGFTLRLGDWKLALRDVGVVDTLICDPPYGARTHASETTRADGSDVDGLAPDYEAWTPDDVARFVAHWSTRVRGWMVALTSHDLIPAWEAAYLAADRYSFAPVPCVIRGMSVRVRADGPSSWAIYAMVARPRNAEFVNWRTLPGAYVGPSQPGAESGRGKPLWLMKELVGDYSRENDLVCDPLAGYGSTLLAALETGRRAVGAERDHGAYDEAYRRAATPREEPTNP
ncbi:MAG TPA: DNA methyltransferase, partial [Microbacterium sp.]|nr:DNA methyltransferase [Microbacterium sp.]